MEILSILLQAFVHIKIFLYKRKENLVNVSGNQLNTSGPQSLAASIDSESLLSFGINLSIILCLASTTVAVKKIGDVSPKKYNVAPITYLIYYNNFIVPSIIPVLMSVLIFKRNKALRKTVLAAIGNFWSNLMDRANF